MQRSNVQIRISPQLHRQIKELALGSQAEFIRAAIEEKIQKEKFKRMEEQWIKALKQHPEDNLEELNDWLGDENWGEK